MVAARNSPGVPSAAPGGDVGSGRQVSTELSKQNANIDIMHLPARGGPQACTEVAGNQVEVAIGDRAAREKQPLGADIGAAAIKVQEGRDGQSRMLTSVAASLVVFAGFAVGVTSIGGILVVPTLTAIGGVPLREAIAASNFSFAFGGAAALILQSRRGVATNVAASTRAPALFYWAALIGAAIGALTLQWLPLALVRMMVAFLAVLSGLLALRPVRLDGAGIAEGGVIPAALLIGVVVGCVSAWSGTGGPITLLPILMFARVPMLLAVGAGQAVQLPIAAATGVVNLLTGQLNLALGITLGMLQLLGWFAGWRLARHLPTGSLKYLLAYGLIAVGLWFGWGTVTGVMT